MALKLRIEKVVSVIVISIKEKDNSLPLVPRQFPQEPSQPVRPIDHIQMTNVLQRAFVNTPLGTLHTHQPIILTLQFLNDAMALTKHAPEAGVHGRAVRVVRYPFPIRSFWVELVAHVVLGELAEGAGFETKELEDGVESWDIGGFCLCVSLGLERGERGEEGRTNGQSTKT